MLQFEELKQQLNALGPKIADLALAIGLIRIKGELEALEKKTHEPDFWNDLEASHKNQQLSKQLSIVINLYEKLKNDFEDAYTLIEIADEENDESLLDEVKAAVKAVESNLETQTLSTLLSGNYDHNNAIMTLHSGAGGTEAQDWVEMLYRLFCRWAERKGYKIKVLDYIDGDEAGIKTVSVLIEGLNAYGFLKSEAGVHRLVRISPFDSSGRRHTSFASVEVMPEIDEDVEIDIRDDDLKVDTYRSGGAGGQHVNKTESAIRITHIPTGVVVACQNERSQHKNRDFAMKVLKSKLIEIKEREHLDKIEDIKGFQKEITWGSQIRSYVFMPYTLVKDHRTSFESGNVNAIMDGEIDGFINAYLKAKSNGEI